MGLRSRMFLLFLKLTVITTIFAHGMERFGILGGSSITFTGLSLDVRDVSKGRCAARYGHFLLYFEFNYQTRNFSGFLTYYPILKSFEEIFFESTNRNRVQYHLLPEFKRYVTQFFQCSLLLFVSICLVIISERHLSHKLLWFC